MVPEDVGDVVIEADAVGVFNAVNVAVPENEDVSDVVGVTVEGPLVNTPRTPPTEYITVFSCAITGTEAHCAAVVNKNAPVAAFST